MTIHQDIAGHKFDTAGAPEHGADFDPLKFPILATHWPGLAPPSDGLRRGHLVRHLHRVGERAVLELLNEPVALAGGRDAGLDQHLEAYSQLHPEVVEALGAAAAVPPVLHGIAS